MLKSTGKEFKVGQLATRMSNLLLRSPGLCDGGGPLLRFPLVSRLVRVRELGVDEAIAAAMRRHCANPRLQEAGTCQTNSH